MLLTGKSQKSISIILVLALFSALLLGCSNSKAASAKVNEKLELAVKYLGENKYEEAILTYQDVIKIDSKNITAYKGLSLAYQLVDKMDQAEKALSDGLKAMPQTLQLKLALAGLMLDQEKADQAEAIYKELTSADNPPLSAYKAYAYYLNKRGKQAEAIALLEQAVAKNNKDYNLNSMLAELYYQNKDQEKAIAAINNSLTGQLEQAGSFKLLAEMYQDKWTELIALGDQYIQENQAQTGQLLKLSGLFGLGKYDDVIKLYTELAGDLRNNAQARLIAAQAYLKLDKKDQIAELLKPLRVAELHDAAMLAELSNVYLEAGDKENARKLALQGIGSDQSIIDNYIVMYKSCEGEDKLVAQIWAIKYLIMSGLSYNDSFRELSMAGIVLSQLKGETYKWSGTYYYDNGESVSFYGNINQQGDNIFGILSEIKTSFGPNQPYLESSIVGTIHNNQVNFVKIYSYDKNHTVVYSGTLYPNEKAIRGTWKISETTGRFDISLIVTP